MTTEESQSQPAAERLVSDLESLKIYSDPLRTRILQELSGQPRTIHEVAAVLDVPFTRLYYQFNLLEKHGFIRVVATRPMSGAVEEKVYQVTAYMFVVDRKLLTVGPQGENEGLEWVLQTTFDHTKADIRKSIQAGVIDLAQRAPHPQALYIRRGIAHLSPEQAQRWYERLNELVNELASDEESAEGAYYNFVMALYPSVMPLLDADKTDIEREP